MASILDLIIRTSQKGSGAKDAARDLKSLDGVINQVKTAFTGLAVYGVAKAAFELAELGAESIRAGHAFENISGGSREATANLEAMRAATRGAMSETEMMQAASRLMQMGLAEGSVELGRIAEMATRLGSAMGMEAGPALSNFTLMLANQSIPRLDSYGISGARVRARILELQAATAGMSREQAFMIATMEEGERAMARLGEATDDELLTFERLKASWADVKALVGEELAPAFADALDVIVEFLEWVKENRREADALTEAFGEEAVAAARMTDQVGDMAHAYGYLSTEERDALTGMEDLRVEMRRTEEAASRLEFNLRHVASAAEENVQRIEPYVMSLEDLRTAISGPVARAGERFVEQQSDIQERLAEVTAELEELEAQQGAAIYTQEELIMREYDAQVAAERLAEAQRALAENTDPERQLELENAVARAASSMSEAGQAYVDNRERIGELRGEHDELEASLSDLREAHAQAMKGIIFDMVMARMTADGEFTQMEMDLATAMAESMGLIDESTAETLEGVSTVLTEFYTGAPLNETINKMNALALFADRDYVIEVDFIARGAEAVLGAMGRIAAGIGAEPVYGGGGMMQGGGSRTTNISTGGNTYIVQDAAALSLMEEQAAVEANTGLIE